MTNDKKIGSQYLAVNLAATLNVIFPHIQKVFLNVIYSAFTAAKALSLWFLVFFNVGDGQPGLIYQADIMLLIWIIQYIAKL